MKKTFIYLLLLVAFITVSCKKEVSLQSYLVESQDKKGFVNFNIPTNLFELSVDKSSEDDKKILASIHKINITGLPYKTSDEVTYEIEKEKLKAILKSSDYKKLINFKEENMHVSFYYSGKADAIDEIIAFGYGKEKGVGIARILGDKMNITKIMEMLQNAKLNSDNLDFEKFSSLFGI
ncbi:DUF4252 domain-containing protein [Tenacibaculum salmonis]|uniref:DUF4252 domain-containing protein n=1 Tax=Tenacibaculum sp. P3-BQ1 TaxID=3232310 RepID=UPI0034E02B60